MRKYFLFNLKFRISEPILFFSAEKMNAHDFDICQGLSSSQKKNFGEQFYEGNSDEVFLCTSKNSSFFRFFKFFKSLVVITSQFFFSSYEKNFFASSTF